MNNTPSSNRVHIGIFGKRNAGKSSLINSLTGQELAIVSEMAGTTTDPVSKAMELLPLGPVIMIDTAGLDDDSELGKARIEKTMQTLEKVDIALVVADIKEGITSLEKDLIKELELREVPFITVLNKCDRATCGELYPETVVVSALTKEGIEGLKEQIGQLKPNEISKYPIISDMTKEGDVVVLVVPIDKAAPKGRLILPQQQTIRDLLDNGGISVVCRETELENALAALGSKPRFVVTDSQAFEEVAKIVPENVPLTSFSILFARHKGLLDAAVKGIEALDTLKEGDSILIAEGCTHHRQCDDIGTVKMPKWIEQYTGKKFNYEFCSGGEFKDDLSKYSLIVHCGGCMLTARTIRYRQRKAMAQGVPITNYGTLIAKTKGIFERSIKDVSF